MSNDDYGNLGTEMKAMKDERRRLMAQTKARGRRRKAETKQALADADKFMADTSQANAKLAARTRQILAEAQMATAKSLAEAAETSVALARAN